MLRGTESHFTCRCPSGKPAAGALFGRPADYAKNIEAWLRQSFAEIETAQAKGQIFPGRNSEILGSRIEKSTSTTVFASRIVRARAPKTLETVEFLSVVAFTVINGYVFRLEMQGRFADGAWEAGFVKTEEALIAAAQARQR